MKAKQTDFETILKKMVASDLEVDINDAEEEQAKIAQTLEKVLAGKNGNYNINRLASWLEPLRTLKDVYRDMCKTLFRKVRHKSYILAI